MRFIDAFKPNKAKVIVSLAVTILWYILIQPFIPLRGFCHAIVQCPANSIRIGCSNCKLLSNFYFEGILWTFAPGLIVYILYSLIEYTVYSIKELLAGKKPKSKSPS